MLTSDPMQRLREAVADRETFVRLILSDVAASGDEPAYRKLSVRPSPKGGAMLQVDCFTEKRHTVRHEPPDAVQRFLERPFARAHLQTAGGDVHVRVTKRGKVLWSEGRPSRTADASPAPHNRAKHRRIAGDRPDDLLQALGIQTASGQIRASRRDKFHQINQFLDIMASLETVRRAKGAFRVVDCGCGAAYLTFAAHRYLGHALGLEPHTVGIDAERPLIARCEAIRARLGYERMSFEAVRIADYRPAVRPDLVLSLHACDTATDEAIALGVRSKAHAILAAPCCQHELREQIAHGSMNALLRHGVLRSRQADLVTDAARAALLRVAGYTCDVIEFVSPEHTGKNVMLRAERRSSKPLPGAEADYAALKEAWHIEPALERLLGTP